MAATMLRVLKTGSSLLECSALHEALRELGQICVVVEFASDARLIISPREVGDDELLQKHPRSSFFRKEVPAHPLSDGETPFFYEHIDCPSVPDIKLSKKRDPDRPWYQGKEPRSARKGAQRALLKRQ